LFKTVRRFAYWAIAIAVVALTVYLALRPRPVLVDVAEVTQGPMDVRVQEDAQTRIHERYVVSTPLTGRLLRITLEVGDLVLAGQTVLARLQPTDPDFLDPRTAAQARARVKAAEQRLQAAKAELAKAETAVDFAEREMGRVRQSLRSKAASQREFDEVQLDFRLRTEEAKAAGFAVDIAEYELELERAALMMIDPEQQEDSKAELKIKAPIDGRVLRIIQESSTVVTAGSPLMELGDPSDLEVVADVLSRDAVRISPGDKVLLKRWGGDRDLQGRVRLVEPSGFTKVSALGVEEQRVNVVIDLVDPPEQRRELGDGFRVDAEVIVWESEKALQVPTSALFRKEGQWHVFTMNSSEAHLQPVTIGQNNGLVAEVIDGLSSDDTVIIHPSDEVEDGVKVARR